MRKLFSLFAASFLFIVISLAMISAPVRAVSVTKEFCDTATTRPKICDDASAGESTNPVVGSSGVVTRAVRILVMAAGIIAVFVMLANAVGMITAGSSEAFGRARNGLIFAVIGLVVIIMSQAIITFIIERV